MQVGPSLLVLGEEARENGLKYSLLERLEVLYKKCGGYALQHMVSLNTNYRCHEDIMKIPNELFYESRIKLNTAVSTHPQAKYALMFICSSLTSNVDQYLEAELVLQQIKTLLLLNWPAKWGKRDLKKIGLVTASRVQV